MKKKVVLLLFLLQWAGISFSQAVREEEAYPQVTGYFSIVHPLWGIDKNGSSFNFRDSYTVGFPTGVNIIKSDRIGFSFEITPFIKADDSVSRVSSVMFHPGLMFRKNHGFTLSTRLAFETTGRYGFTIVFSKAFWKRENHNFFVSTPFGFRFGNDGSPSAGIGLQFGIGF